MTETGQKLPPNSGDAKLQILKPAAHAARANLFHNLMRTDLPPDPDIRRSRRVSDSAGIGGESWNS